MMWHLREARSLAIVVWFYLPLSGLRQVMSVEEAVFR